MTPSDEAHFIALWQAGTETAEIGHQLSISHGTVSSRTYTLARQGKIQPSSKGGPYPRQKVQARQEDLPVRTLAPPAAARKEIQQWTVRLSKALIEYLKAAAYERRIHPSPLLEELVWHALQSDTEEHRCPPAGSIAAASAAGFSRPGIERMRDYLRRTTDGSWVIDCSPDHMLPSH